MKGRVLQVVDDDAPFVELLMVTPPVEKFATIQFKDLF